LLYRLPKLSDAAAASLGKHKGRLDLSGLTELSDAAAESLSKQRGYLGLGSLTELSDVAAASLAKRKGWGDSLGLGIMLKDLPASAAKILRDAGHGG
jgi:hypothetical protein